MRFVVVVLVLAGCFEAMVEHHHEVLEQRQQQDCGKINVTKQIAAVDAIVACLNDHLDAGTAAKAHQSDFVGEHFIYTMDGSLIVIHRPYDGDPYESHCDWIAADRLDMYWARLALQDCDIY